MGRRAATIPVRSAAFKHQCRAIAPGSPMTIGVVQYSGCSPKGLAKYYRHARSPAFLDLGPYRSSFMERASFCALGSDRPETVSNIGCRSTLDGAAAASVVVRPQQNFH